jgi:hypothetical protein
MQRRHKCPRCGMVRSVFRDEDFYEVFHERMALEAELRALQKQHARMLLRLGQARFALENAESFIAHLQFAAALSLGHGEASEFCMMLAMIATVPTDEGGIEVERKLAQTEVAA